MNKAISFIVCSNGYGHYKRVCSVVLEIYKKRPLQSIFIFCDFNQFEKIKNWPITKKLLRLELIHFNFSLKNFPDWLNNRYTIEEYNLWNSSLQKSKELNNSRLIISDNYSSPLTHYPNAILMGSFLWHNVFETRPSTHFELLEKERKLVQRIKPKLICNSDMVMPEALEYTQAIKMPWNTIRTSHNLLDSTKIRILITGGGTKKVDEKMLKIIDSIKFNTNYEIFLDSNLSQLFGSNSENVSRFNFGKSDFQSLTFIICRPGIGILTDAVTYSIPVLSCYEEDNIELRNNAKKMEELGLGIDINKIETNTLQTRLSQILINENYIKYSTGFKKLKTNGIKKTSEYILSLI